jgi:hypothetical protein
MLQPVPVVCFSYALPRYSFFRLFKHTPEAKIFPLISAV